MTPSGRILIIDDETRFVETYRRLLSAEGYSVDAASTPDEARARLDAASWDVVLLDRKLQGALGPDSGLDMLADIRMRAPLARTIVVTGYADEETVKRAFDAGVYDYLVKGTHLGALLSIKVRNALEAPRERMLAALTNGRREEAIRKAWDEFKSETDRLQKGIILETLVALLFRSIRGFDETMTNRRTADEEIDILIRNESTDPFWHNEGAYILGECKNWSRPIDPREIDRFRMKLQRRYGRSKLGFFIAAAGFTSGVESTLLAGREGSALVVCINRADLEELVLARDRAEKLKALHSRAVVGGED